MLFFLGLRRAVQRFLVSYADLKIHDAGKQPIFMEYIDDVLLKICPTHADKWLPLLEHALGTISLKSNMGKCKILVPSARPGDFHPSLINTGLTQVFGHMEILGNALDGMYASALDRHQNSGHSFNVPSSSLKRLSKAEERAKNICGMIATPLAIPARRAAWILLDKVLNKAMDYDARILHLEAFSKIATRLDEVVMRTALKVVDVAEMVMCQQKCMRLSAKRGGCDLVEAQLKPSFAHLASSVQCLPGLSHRLVYLGFSREVVGPSLETSGIHYCLQSLAQQGLHIGACGTVMLNTRPQHCSMRAGKKGICGYTGCGAAAARGIIESSVQRFS